MAARHTGGIREITRPEPSKGSLLSIPGGTHRPLTSCHSYDGLKDSVAVSLVGIRGGAGVVVVGVWCHGLD